MNNSMSGHEADASSAIGRALTELESSVHEVLDGLSRLRREGAEQRRRLDEARELLRRVQHGDVDALELTQRLQKLETENAELRRRIERGREGVERLLARVRFAEEQQ